jgi:hypothetical protein
MSNTVLLCGIQKAGNTLCRFVIFNYFNVLNNKATKTLNWDELQKPHLDRVEHGLDYEYKDGFPMVFHTHNAYDGQGLNVKYEGYPEFFQQFDKLIYLYRNPFDCMISYWHFVENRNGVDYQRDLKEFTKWFLPKWIHHVKTTRCKADLVLDYDKLRRNPYPLFTEVIALVNNGIINIGILDKTIEMSSFENIRKMSDEVGNPAGLGNPHYRGYFCRDGRSGQYKEVMSKELIDYIRNECKKEGIEV